MRNLGLLVCLFAVPAFASELQDIPMPQPPEDVFVSFDHADLAAAQGFPLANPVLTDGRTAVYQIKPDMLPVLSQFMHDNFNRCGGYFAHRSRGEAQAAMRPSAISAGGPYTLDQRAVAGPIAAAVKPETIKATIDSLSAFHNRYYTSDTGVQAAEWIRSRWAGLAAAIPGAKAETFAHAGWKQPSVILTIPGAEKPEEIVVLGGHLDSIAGWGGGSGARAPGADDNASGIATLTETIRVIAESGWRPKRTIQFMGYAAEEVGLRGSQDVAAKYAAGGKKVIGVIQFDMTNFLGSEDKIYVLTDHVDPALTEFTKKLVDAYAGVPWSTTKCGYACSDHASWTKKGFPSSMAFEAAFDDSNKNIHTANDTLANMGGTAAHSVPFAKLAAGFAVELAKTAEPAVRTAGLR